MVDKVTASQSKFVGVWLSQQTNSFLSLYALSKGISKSKIIRDDINTWVEETKQEYPVRDLITVLIGKYQEEWDNKKRIYKLTNPNRFDMFKEDLAIYLQRKGLEESTVSEILEGLQQ